MTIADNVNALAQSLVQAQATGPVSARLTEIIEEEIRTELQRRLSSYLDSPEGQAWIANFVGAILSTETVRL